MKQYWRSVLVFIGAAILVEYLQVLFTSNAAITFMTASGNGSAWWYNRVSSTVAGYEVITLSLIALLLVIERCITFAIDNYHGHKDHLTHDGQWFVGIAYVLSLLFLTFVWDVMFIGWAIGILGIIGVVNAVDYWKKLKSKKKKHEYVRKVYMFVALTVLILILLNAIYTAMLPSLF